MPCATIRILLPHISLSPTDSNMGSPELSHSSRRLAPGLLLCFLFLLICHDGAPSALRHHQNFAVLCLSVTHSQLGGLSLGVTLIQAAGSWPAAPLPASACPP